MRTHRASAKTLLLRTSAQLRTDLSRPEQPARQQQVCAQEPRARTHKADCCAPREMLEPMHTRPCHHNKLHMRLAPATASTGQQWVLPALGQCLLLSAAAVAQLRRSAAACRLLRAARRLLRLRVAGRVGAPHPQRTPRHQISAQKAAQRWQSMSATRPVDRSKACLLCLRQRQCAWARVLLASISSQNPTVQCAHKLLAAQRSC